MSRYSREYYQANRARLLAYQQLYRQRMTPEQREAVSAAQKAWRIANPEALDRYNDKRTKVKG